MYRSLPKRSRGFQRHLRSGRSGDESSSRADWEPGAGRVGEHFEDVEFRLRGILAGQVELRALPFYLPFRLDRFRVVTFFHVPPARVMSREFSVPRATAPSRGARRQFISWPEAGTFTAMERALYPLISEALMTCFGGVGKHNIHIESTDRGFSEPIKATFGRDRDIAFSFFDRAKPYLTGYVDEGTHKVIFVVEVKDAPFELRDIYQAKRYKGLLGARFGFVTSSQRTPEKLKRLCSVTPAILNWFPEINSRHALSIGANVC